jgi:hypothetical protein
MTTRKSFKRVIRARMAKTGERYAAARRALVAETPRGGIAATGTSGSTAGAPGALDEAAAATPDQRDPGGLQPLTASLTNVVAQLGVRSPIDGARLSEATILGIGGGLGAGYILWEFKARNDAILTLGFGNRWQYPFERTATMLDRLGLTAQIHETNGAKGAREALDRSLAEGDPVIAWIDQQAIGTWCLPDSLSGYWGYPVVVTGRVGDGRYLVDDRGRAPLVVDEATMAAARARIGSWKHHLVRVSRPAAPLTAARLRAAIRAGLEDQVDHLRKPSDSFSLPAWRKWSRLMTDTRNAKAWPRVFAGGRGLFGTLLSVVENVDGDVGATGGHLRELYAAALDEAAVTLDLPRLTDAAGYWRAAADLWEDLADAAVPSSLPDGIEAIEAAERLHDAVMLGEPGRPAAATAARELWDLRAANAASPALDGEMQAALFADLGERLRTIYEAEVVARDVTAGAIGR